MTYRRHIKLVLSLVFISIIFISCSNNTSKKECDDMEFSIRDKNLEICKNAVETFFNNLKTKKFDDCLNYFSDSLIMSQGNEKITEALINRNSQSGLPDSIQIYYSTKLQQDKLYTFYIRCFSKVNSGGISYDKIVIKLVDVKPEFVSYEFSPKQYCDLIMANDSLSEINIYLTKVYRTINEKGADEAFKLLDSEVAANIDKSDFENIYANIKKQFESKSIFVVRSVWSDLKMGIPVLTLIVESHCKNSEVYIDELLISDRLGEYFLGKIEREPKLEAIVQQLPRPSNAELKPFADQAAAFYNMLIKENVDKIIDQVDKVVFINNEYNLIKSSFTARNQYYGKPLVLKNTNVKAFSIGGNTVVDFNFTVENSSGKKSYEKVSIVRNSKLEYLLYGYDFRDEQF